MNEPTRGFELAIGLRFDRKENDRSLADSWKDSRR